MKKLNRTGTFGTVVAGAVVLAVFGTGSAVAGSMITSANIKDNTIRSVDLQTGSVRSVDVRDNSVGTVDLRDGSVSGTDIADGSLSNQDVGVLFASVNQDGALENSSGNVQVTRTALGNYSVDFGRDVRKCAFVATGGGVQVGTAEGQVHVSDKAQNSEAVFVATTDSAGVSKDLDFHVLAVC